MNLQKITTLTPIHIGSGIQAMRDIDFLFFEKQGKASFIDSDKVLEIIGEENIGQWTSCIENRKGFYELLSSRKKDLVPSDIDARTMNVKHAGLSEKNELKEQLHTGMGLPLLPGSSIKGAVRTALFADFIKKNKGNDVKNRQNLLNFRKQFEDKQLIKKYFGDDPNHDILRLLKIMDASFISTDCYRAETINLKRNGWEIDTRFTQFIEAIPANTSSSFSFKFDETIEQRAKEKRFFNQDTSNLHPNKLFPIINAHTLDLAEREIAYWVDQGEPDALGFYIDKMRDICDKIKYLRPDECILRMGWGTGFRNMTGDWHINMTDDDFYSLINNLRPRHPEDMAYPKSMRILKDGTPLGFLKINL
jgi:CRISPR-associated protein Csm5